MAKTVNLTIDDQPVSVPAGTLVVDAAKLIGNDIPVFCYHPKMEPVGMCRMCLVEIGRPAIDRATGKPQLDDKGAPIVQFGPKLETACTTPVSEGMVVRTTTAKVTDARREVLEFLLTSHPLDCPICDKGGECPLQNLTLAHGPGKSRFLLDDKIHLAKHYPLGELIYLDRERCIQCARCVRFQSDLAGDPVIGFSQRGRALEIITCSEPGFDSIFSGNTTDICPVGALTTADFRFAARPWELKHSASICTQCPVGCNLTIDVRREAVSSGRAVVKRIMPRQNEEVNEIWICDKGRFAYHFAESTGRILQPLIRRNGEFVKATWEEALDLIVQRVRSDGAGARPVALAGGRLSNEDLFNLKALTDGLGGRAIQYTHMAGGEWTARAGLGPGSNIGTMGPETAILVVASDLHEEAPIWYLRLRAAAKRGAKLIVLNARPTRLDEVAAHVVRYAPGAEVDTLVSFFPGAAVTDALKAAVEAFSGAENAVIFFGSDGLGLAETRALAETCAALLSAGNRLGRPNNGLVGVWPKANNQGAFDMGFQPVDDLAAALRSAGLLYIVGADPVGDDPALAEAVGAAGFRVVQELFMTETARLADVVLPAQSFIEREGTFTSGERRVQRFYPAVSPLSGARADYAIIGMIGQRLGLAVEPRSASLVMLRIAESVPGYAGLTYPKISAVRQQYPIIGRADLYYGGTTYDNHQGLGVQLAPLGLAESTPVQPPAARRAAAEQPNEGEVRVLPVTRLYDRGTTVTPSVLLHARLAKAELRMNPAAAAALGLADHEAAALAPRGSDRSYPVTIRVDNTLPDGVMTLPRSVGVPLTGPLFARLLRVAETAGR